MAIQADFHLHSDFSNDSWTPMGTMVEAALARGLKEICFTEHTDLGGPRSYYCDMQTYREIVEALNARYAGRVCSGERRKKFSSSTIGLTLILSSYPATASME